MCNKYKIYPSFLSELEKSQILVEQGIKKSTGVREKRGTLFMEFIDNADRLLNLGMSIRQ